jgi:hypothetical protein
MKYEYGKNQEQYVGTIEFRIDVPKETKFEDREPKLAFYESNSFSRLTSSALQGIAKFIRENKFPDNYLRATY